MKKISFLILFASLISFTISANTNRVGDSIEYTGNYGGQPARMTMSYISFDGNYMTQASQIYINGQMVSDSTEMIDADSIMTMETAAMMVAMCSQFGGVQEYLDLPVGKTLTCRVEASAATDDLYNFYKNVFADAGTIWLGPFPVTGIAQMTISGTLVQVSNYQWK